MTDGQPHDGHDHADTRYLDAKATVDDRALDRRVADRLRDELPASPTVFDAGCGTGVTLPRLREWGVDPAGYRGVDTDAGLIAAARERHAADTVSFAVGDAVAAAREVADSREAADPREAADSREAADDSFAPDLAVAGSFLDLVPVGSAVDALAAAVGSGGLVYAPFTFDGTTAFAPAHPADDLVERIYHETIDGQPGRNVRAGRAAVDHCRRADGELLAVGASDWVVRPDGDGYPNDERYFLSCILGFVADALFAGSDGERSDRAAAALADTDHTVAELRDWLQCRRQQAADGELIYTASQFDVLYRC